MLGSKLPLWHFTVYIGPKNQVGHNSKNKKNQNLRFDSQEIASFFTPNDMFFDNYTFIKKFFKFLSRALVKKSSKLRF